MMMGRIPRWVWLAGLLGSLCGVFWFSIGLVRVRPPCPTSWPTHIDPRRLLVLAFEVRPPVDAAQIVFEQDLLELLVAGGYQIVPASSTAAQSWPPHCVANHLQLKIGPVVGLDWVGKEATRIEGVCTLSHFGREVYRGSQTQPATGGAIFRELRENIAQRLLPERMFQGGASSSLLDSASPGFAVRTRAMSAFAEGQTGEAVELLRGALAREGRDAALHYRQGSLLLSWAESVQMTISGPKPLVKGQGERRLLEVRVRGLLGEALGHLDRSLELAPGAPLTYLARARVYEFLDLRSRAEKDYREVVVLNPAQSEAALAIGRLSLVRAEASDVEDLLVRALFLMASGSDDLRAESFTLIGQAQLLRNQPIPASNSLQRALELVPPENRQAQIKAWALLAQAQEKLGQFGPACNSWRSYRKLLEGGLDPDGTRIRAFFEASGRCPNFS